jgi:hypothetical protein
MAALQSTASGAQAQRHIIGDLDIRFYVLSGNNGDTITVQQSNIMAVIPVPTTAISMGYTVAGSTITFVTGGAWAATVTVISRIG